MVRRLPAPGPIAFGRGLEIALELDDLLFQGNSPFLFGAVMERFFARYVSINSFTETVLRSTTRGPNHAMGAAMRRTTDPLTLFRALQAAPYRHDFYQALRRIECAFPDKPRWGRALRPADEPVRLAQEPALSFAPAALSAFRPPDRGFPARLEVRFLGLLGPNGPLAAAPDRARARTAAARRRPDASCAFSTLFNHRFLALFYRAWAQAQPTVSLDRPRDDRFSAYVGSLIGAGHAAVAQPGRGAGFRASLFYAGLAAAAGAQPRMD